MNQIAQRLSVIGTGLIGGSAALALKAAGRVGEVVGCGRSRDNLEVALRRGIIDRAEQDVARAVQDADMVLVCTPVGAMEAVLRQVLPAIGPDAVVTDAGSVKQSVIAQACAAGGGKLPPRFVPGHPIAGNENSGAAAADAALYRGRRVLLTPGPETATEALARVRALWEACGAQVRVMDAGVHDRILGLTSHLPHLAAFALMNTLAASPDAEDLFQFAAGGLRDTTRVAASDPVMWRDIFLANREPLLAASQALRAALAELEAGMTTGDAAALEQAIRRARDLRRRFQQRLDAASGD
jgi:prephenate dehydrogenase